MFHLAVDVPLKLDFHQYWLDFQIIVNTNFFLVEYLSDLIYPVIASVSAYLSCLFTGAGAEAKGYTA